MIEPTAIIQLIGFFVAVAAAAVWLRSALVKQRHEELEQLAETRGERIADLQAQVVRQGKEIKDLQAQVKHIQALMESNIADRIAEKVIEQLGSLES